MASGNRSTTFTVNIDANIKDLLQKSDQAKSAIGNIFNTSNLGQSLKGDFNKLEKILTRIQNTASGPIRSDWGAENLIADFSRAGLKLDDMISKLEEIKKDKNLRIDILSDSDVQDFNKVLEYNKKLGEQLQKNKKTEAEIVRLQQEQAKATADEATKKAKYNQAVIAERAARGQLTKTQNKYGVQNYTREEFKQAWTSQLAGFLTKSGDFNALGTRLGLSKSLLNGNDYLDVKSIIAKASAETVQRKNDQGITVNEKLYKTQDELDKLEETLNKINDLKKEALTFEVKNNNVVKAQSELSKLSSEYSKASSTLAQVNADLAANQGKLSNTFNTQEWKEFEQIAQQVGVDISNINSNSGIDEIQKKVQAVSDALDQKAVTSIDNVANHLKGLTQENRNVQQSTEGVIDAQKREHEQMRNVDAITNRIKMFTGFYGIMNMIRRSINSAITTIKELDEQMTKMAVVTSPTISDYWKQLPQYTKRANALGAAIKEVYEADTLYYQQGLKTNQVIQVSNETMKMARIAALDAAEATDRMTSAMRGFNMEINETSAQRVNDVYSQLAAITASDVNEISVAMTKTASIAHSAGMEFETTAAFLSQIIETTRESADTAGTALKTIIARFEELKKSPSEIGEIDGEVVDANKIEKALRTVGIALRDTQGQFRNLDDVFLELSSKWDDLDKNTQRYIATIAAGSRQQSRFIAMMQNYAHTTELVAKANGSAGASQKQFEKTLDSMKTKLNALKNAWDTFTMGILDSDFLKSLVSIGTTFVEVFNKIGKAIDSLNVYMLGSVTRVAMLVTGMRTLGKVARATIPFLTGGKTGFWGATISRGILDPNSADAAEKMSFKQALANRGSSRRNYKSAYAFAKYYGYTDDEAKKYAAKTKILPNNAESSLKTKEGWTNLGSGVVSLAKFAAIIAAIAVTVKLIGSLYNHTKYISEEEKIKRDKEALESYNEELKKSKDLLSSIKDSRTNYENLRSELADMVKGTTAWNDKVKENNALVLDLITTYKQLALYVERSSATGELTISTKGWNELEKEQNKKIAAQTIKVQNQERRVNNNALNTSIKRLNESTSELGNYLNKMSSQELEMTFTDDKQIALIADAFNTTDNEIREAVHAIAENKAAIETTEATIQTTNQLLNDQNNEGDPTVEYAQLMGMQARQEEEKNNSFYKQLSKGTTYENSAAKEILSFYGIDPDVINGRGDTEILAILKGAVNGITDIEEAISKYSSDTGFWDFNRTDIAKEISQKFVEARATKKAQEDTKGYETFATNNPLFKKFVEQGAGGLSYNEKKQILNNTNIRKDFEEWMKQNNIKDSLEDKLGFTSDQRTREMFNTTFLSSSDNEIDKTRTKIKSLNNAYLDVTAKLPDVVKQFIEETGAERIKNYLAARATSGNVYTKGAELGLDKDLVNQIESYLSGGNSIKDVDFYARYLISLDEYNKRIQAIENTFERLSSNKFLENTSDLGINLQANLGSVFTNAAIQSGKDAALGLIDSFNSIYENLNDSQKEQLANLLTQFDITDTKGLKEFKKALDETGDAFGDSKSVISILADQIWDLNNAIEKVNFSELTSAIKNIGSLVEEINNNTWGGTITEDQKKALITAGVDADRFYTGSSGNIHFSGSEEELKNIFTEAINTGLIDLELGLNEKIYNAQRKGELSSAETINNLETKEQLVSAIETALNKLGLNDKELERLQWGENWADQSEDALKNLYSDLLGRGGEYLTQKETVENLKNQYVEIMEHFGGFYNDLIHPDKRENNVNALKALIDEITTNGLDQTNKREFDELQELLGKQVTNKQLTPEEKAKMQELAKYFTTRLSYSTAKKGFSEILSTAVQINEKLQEVPLDTQEAFDQIDTFMKKVGMKTGEITKENAQEYANFIAVIANGGEDAYMAYQGLTEKVLETNGYAVGALMKLDGAYYDNLDDTLKAAADLLYNYNLAYFENGFLKLYDMNSFLGMLDDAGGKDKDEKVNPWENPYDWLWNITEQINKTLYQRERLERKYKLAVDDTTKSAEDLYDISKKELSNLEEQARLQSLKGQKATEEAQLLLSHYKEYAKYVSMNPLTGQVQVAYEELDKKGWSQEQGSAFEAFVSRLTELASEIKDSNTTLEEIEDEVKEIQNRGRDELIALQNRVKDALVTERQREIDTLQEVNDAISNQQSKLLEAMQQEIEETRRIRENTDKQEEIEKKRQRLSYLQRDTSGANQTEILGLQEEIENDTISYQDSLIDQSLQKMQEDNELAAEKRQEQVDIMNNQLARWTESGEIWNTVGPLLEEYFGGDNGNLQGIISNAENWQALTALEKADLEDELYNNGQLAKLFNEGNLYKAADGTRGIVQSYTNTMAEKITKAGVLGNEVLDKGNYLKVTLKDFTPKVDETNSKLGSLNSSVNAIYQWLQKIKLTESGGNLANATQSLKALATAGTTATANSIKTEYQSAVEDFVSLATGSASLGKEEAINKVSDAIQMNKDLANYLRNEYHTENFDLVAKNLLTHAHYKGFSTGGLVTETGPAWLHGTPSKPEYVLNAKQTDMLFESLDNTNKLSKDGSQSSGGDNYFNVTVNVDEIANDYDVDKAIARVKQSIIEDSNYRNVNFISGFTY